MFVLKLYRRLGGSLDDPILTKIMQVHHVTVQETDSTRETLEIWAHKNEQGGDCDVWYVGKKTPAMTAVNFDNHFDWGLLENAEGRTTQHFRPYGHGHA